MKVGDKIIRCISLGDDRVEQREPREGTVIYVHPDRRFYTVEYRYDYMDEVRVVRESYPLKNRITNASADADDEPLPGRLGPRLPGESRRRAHTGGYAEALFKRPAGATGKK